MDAFRPAALTAAALFLLCLAAPARGQTVPPPGTPPGEIRDQIEAMGLQGELLQRIQASGLTPEQIRQELARRGYDPTVLDPYLEDGGEPGRRSAPTVPTPRAISAAEALGLLRAQPLDSLARTDTARLLPDSTAIERERNLRVFGLEVFRRGGDRFQPMTAGPVPADYLIRPGDEIVLILTGDVEQAYSLPVTREGFTVIPQVGQVWVAGLTLDQLRDQLYTHLGRAYSGVRRGPEATTRFQVSLAQLGPNQLFVSGEVVRPGSYLVEGGVSVLNALYHAGGPMPNGSFRDVRVMRGGTLVERVDLYSYLIAGDNLAGVRMQPGDVVFVPTHHAQVSIKGEVARPAIYEMLPGETLLDLVEFAGGLNAPAHLRRARITRILPPEQRTEIGVDRTVIDVDLLEIVRDPSLAPGLTPGDAVEIFPVRTEIRNTVSVRGSVWHEGTFRYESGMRVWDLIDLADGLRRDAHTRRAQILRLDPSDSTIALLPVDLRRTADGQPVENPVLREFDTLRVFGEAEFTTQFPVTITGEVRNPVADTFYEGMTLRDLILRAGGLQPTADLTVEVARVAESDRDDPNRIAEVFRIQVDSSYFVSDQDRRFYLGAAPADDGAAAEFPLKPYDRVRVRPLPGIEFERTIEIVGEVRYPGTYTLERKDERIAGILERAGGLTTSAYPGGFQLYRDGTLVNVELAAALDDPTGSENVQLLPGDSLFVPEYNPVVLVRGAVNSPDPVAVLYREGAGIDYYIGNAGGYAPLADRDNIHIRHANGEGAIAEPFLLFRRNPTPRPGSVINVPSRPADEGFNLRGTVTDLAQTVGALVTLFLLVDKL